MGSKAYQLKVSLRGTKPPIWRRLLVKDNTSLHRLHRIIQDAMGWQNRHLYHFDTGEVRYTEHFDDDFIDDGEKLASSTRLGDLDLQDGDVLWYLYDFGDDWLHEVEVEQVSPVEGGAEYPRCLAGRRACPPEDCGGVHGYDRILSALRSKSDPERREYLEWLGRDWDPDEFDHQATDRLVREAHRGRASFGTARRPTPIGLPSSKGRAYP